MFAGMSGNAQTELVARCQDVMAHAWMVRTFVKHSEEVEDFPDLHQVVRAVFDASRALDTHAADPPAYFRMLQKKLPKLRKAAEQFAIDAPQASLHTNFAQAVRSLRASVAQLEALLPEGIANCPSA